MRIGLIDWIWFFSFIPQKYILYVNFYWQRRLVVE